MIYEFRTYDLKPRTVPKMELRVAAAIEAREKLSQLAGFWHTEVGPLNQVIHIWPYADLNERDRIRSAAVATGEWPPDNSEFIVDARSEIFMPAPFFEPLTEPDIGPVYDMRVYTYKFLDVPKALEVWAETIEPRMKLSPLAGCWYSDLGGLNQIVHMWAYRGFDERMRVREEARSKGLWPPKGMLAPLRQENKILLPAAFSRMQ